VILVIFLSVIPYDQIYYKSMLAFATTVAFWRIQQYLKPYKLLQFNQLEEREMLCSVITLLCVLLFLSPEELSNFLLLFAFLVFLLVNLRFLSGWIFLLYTLTFP